MSKHVSRRGGDDLYDPIDDGLLGSEPYERLSEQTRHIGERDRSGRHRNRSYPDESAFDRHERALTHASRGPSTPAMRRGRDHAGR